jgi:transcriptional regulator with XRE-family HTH domain
MADDERIEEQLTALGARLKSLRSERGWTLEELAERTGLSKPFLSRMEAGQRQPSIAVVLTLARTYDVPLGELFESSGERQPCVIVRGGQGKPVKTDGLTYVPLSSQSRFGNLQPIRLIIGADRAGDEMYQHEGEEWLFVLSGRLKLSLDGKSYDLTTGDSAHFDSHLPHRLTAVGGEDAELIMVACPIAEPAAGPPRRQTRQWRAIAQAI